MTERVAGRLAFGVMAALGVGLALAPRLVLSAQPSVQALIPNNQGKVRGCSDGGLFGSERVDPHYVSVMPGDPETTAEGVVEKSQLTHTDFPGDHASHDLNVDVKLDPGYMGLNSDANPLEGGVRLMEMEWESAQWDQRFWPLKGDRVWMVGRHIFDCGHPPYRTEIHPPKLWASTRTEAHLFSGDTAPSMTSKTYLFGNGNGHLFKKPTGGRSYSFTVPLPPRTTPSAQFRAEVVELLPGSPAPTLTPLPDATNPTSVRVSWNLTGISSAIGTRVGAILASGWRETTLSRGYRRVRVTLDSVRINEDHDPLASGEWNLWVRVAGRTVKLTNLHDVDNGDTVNIGQTFDVLLPEGASLPLRTLGWEDDCDQAFGTTLGVVGSAPCGIDDNDKIGVIDRGVSPASGSYSERSQRNGDADTAGDFTLSYRVQELARFGAGMANGSGGATRKRVVVTFLRAKVLDDSENFGDGEVWFEIDVNGQKLRFPTSGTRDAGSGDTVNFVPPPFATVTLGGADSLNIRVQGMEEDGGLTGADDSLGVASRVFDATANFGSGTHTVRSTKADGQFEVTFQVSVTSL